MKNLLLMLSFCIFIVHNSFAQTKDTEETGNRFKDKNTVTAGFSGLVLLLDADGEALGSYAGLNLGIEHAVGSHFSYALNMNIGSGPTYGYDGQFIPIYRTRNFMIGPEFRAYTQARQRGFYIGLATNYVQQRVLIGKLANTDKNLDIIQGGLNVNLLLGFQSQITKNVYTRFHTGLGVFKVGSTEGAQFAIPFNLGLGYRF